MSEQQNVQKLQEMYGAFGRGDIAALLANVTDDVSWGVDTVVTEVPWYRIHEGPAGVGEFFETLGREVEFTRFEPTAFIPSGDQVIVTVDYDYRLRRNGRSAGTSVMHRFQLRDGKVTSFRAYEDTAAIRDAWVS